MAHTLETPDVARLEQQLQQLIQQARIACSANGELSSECAVAWDAVEEVQAAAADRRQNATTDFERYCADRPDALECRIYDV